MQNPKSKNADGVRQLKLEDIAPACEIFINTSIYDLGALAKGKKVVDVGCGYGKTRKIVEEAGGEWIGVEPFEGGAHTHLGDAQNLPFADETFDIVYMNAVLEHVPDVAKAFKEVARVLKPGGIFIGYVAFMECFHEISYSHLSFKAIEFYSNDNNLRLLKIGGGRRFGIDYHMAVLFHPLNLAFMRPLRASLIRGIFKFKSRLAYLALRYKRGLSVKDAKAKADLYFKVECLRQSVGFQYYIVK